MAVLLLAPLRLAGTRVAESLPRPHRSHPVHGQATTSQGYRPVDRDTSGLTHKKRAGELGAWHNAVHLAAQVGKAARVHGNAPAAMPRACRSEDTEESPRGRAARLHAALLEPRQPCGRWRDVAE